MIHKFQFRRECAYPVFYDSFPSKMFYIYMYPLYRIGFLADFLKIIHLYGYGASNAIAGIIFYWPSLFITISLLYG